jgi:ganglioside-induced differentiation-associated protein 1
MMAAMGEVTLFHIWPSSCSQKVRLGLAEKGVAYHGRIVNIGPPMENYEPWYVRMNPAAVVPTLKHGERIVTDSLQILRYVDDTFEGPALMPEDDARRALAEQLLARIDGLQIRTLSYAPRREWLRSVLQRVIGARARRLQRHAQRNPDLADAYQRKLEDVQSWQRDVIDPAAAEAAKQEVLATLAELEQALERFGGPFMLGEPYTLVDVFATTLVARVHMLGRSEVLEPLPRLREWYQRMRERPSFAAAAMSEKVDLRKMVPIFLPWLLPRLAIALLVIGAIGWGLSYLVLPR